jgi:Nucleotide-diphospho-sugar transferase
MDPTLGILMLMVFDLALHVDGRHVKEQDLSLVSWEGPLKDMVRETKEVMLTVVNKGYFPLFDSFACNLKWIKSKLPLVLIALDTESYATLKDRGYNVVYYGHNGHSDVGGPLDAGQKGAAGKAYEFGSKGFKALVKAKSRVALYLLKLGVDVFLVDADVVLFRDPFVHVARHPCHRQLHAALEAEEGEKRPQHAQCHLLIQTDQAHDSYDIARNLCSGFYFARAAPATIAAFEAIVAHAMQHPEHSEQYSFGLLCQGGALRAGDATFCQWHVHANYTLYTSVINPHVAASGSLWPHFQELVNKGNTKNNARGRDDSFSGFKLIRTANPRIVSLHNNYIAKVENKLSRLKSTRLWCQGQPF